MIFPCPKPPRRVKRVERAKKGQRAKRSGGHLFEKLVSTGRRAFIRKQRCIATGAKTGEAVRAQDWMPESLKALCPYVARIVAAHVRSRGAAGADEANMVPLEAHVHDYQGQIGWPAFAKRLRLIAPAEIAAEFETKFLARQKAIAKRMGE